MRVTLSIFPLACLLAQPVASAELTKIEELGKALFFNNSLSINETQSCASCHDPAQGFTSSIDEFNRTGSVVEGAVPGLFGNRKPPTAAYASQAPVFHHVFEGEDILFIGGAFYDGRATGKMTGNPAADQAMGPFLNPLEMALPHQACVVERVCGAAEARSTMDAAWGKQICEINFPLGLTQSCSQADAEIVIGDKEMAAQLETAFVLVAQAISAYESSSEVNRFSSKYDRWLEGDATLTKQELAGLELLKARQNVRLVTSLNADQTERKPC